ncbi:MAG TPA: sigma-54 dependent transcriptional regulator [Spirochaetia bacterium]|nr:sigma-54 dependent transcriptional regulator [Spirochaetales bacterium]HRY79820.1 sigma-54 dependent transcriptional regulator [Spirochaetia bacterium]HRZ87957.1 sigma-54 dependent transcriptional regulator [Spirochaetia bacterium]
MSEESKSPGLNILVVDDEPNIRKMLSFCLAGEGHSVTSVGDPGEAVEEARRRPYDLVFLDLRLGERSGMDLIVPLASDSPWMKIVVITAYASVESVVQAMRLGAEDYLPKPFDPEQVRILARRIGRLRAMEAEVAALREYAGSRGAEGSFESRDPAMLRVVETARRAAESDAIVLLCGESGTGKSLLARAIHGWSPRSAKPFMTVSCPAVPQELLESELFGHVKGSFTGALRDHPGRIAACEGGTLFLDEVADMAPPVQAKFLRFIQDKEYERLGESRARKADVRIIAATNADLEERVAQRGFREDLFYRLAVIRLTLPPLRERPDDIEPLASGFLTEFSRAYHRTFLGFTEEARAALRRRAWPGNIRELRNSIERAAILARGPQIDIRDLGGDFPSGPGSPAVGDRVPLSEIERLHIRRVLASAGSLREAASVLGIDPATLWRKRKLYGI